MADLDTTSKRRSSVGLMLISIMAPPLPDGALTQGDRQHIAFSYSGIAAGIPGGYTANLASMIMVAI